MTPAFAAISQYQKVQTSTCSPGQLLVLLYDGLLRFLKEAKAAMENGDRAKSGERIGRSHQILEQLVAGLDPSVDSLLCERLESLYLFCMGHLTEANLHRDPARIAAVIDVLSPLQEAWKVAVDQQSAAAAE